MEEKQFELRRLTATDLFPMATILSKIGFKEFKGCLSSDTMTKLGNLLNGDEANNDNVGILAVGIMAFDIVGIILANLEKCQDELFNFLASLCGMKRKEFDNLDLEIVFDVLLAFAKHPQFSNFFKRASKLVK